MSLGADRRNNIFPHGQEEKQNRKHKSMQNQTHQFDMDFSTFKICVNNKQILRNCGSAKSDVSRSKTRLLGGQLVSKM